MNPKRLVFDTLQYAKMLDKGGVVYSDTHAHSLAAVLTENIYTKQEVDQMIEAALRKIDERTMELKMEMVNLRHEVIHQINHQISQLETRFEKTFNQYEKALHQYVYKTVTILGSILGSMIATLGAVVT